MLQRTLQKIERVVHLPTPERWGERKRSSPAAGGVGIIHVVIHHRQLHQVVVSIHVECRIAISNNQEFPLTRHYATNMSFDSGCAGGTRRRRT